MKEEKIAYVYIVRCLDQSLYTGITTDIERRMKQHVLGMKQAAKYTKSHRPDKIEMVWQVDSYAHAAKIEYRIKRRTRAQKENLILEPEMQMQQIQELAAVNNVIVRRDLITSLAILFSM